MKIVLCLLIQAFVQIIFQYFFPCCAFGGQRREITAINQSALQQREEAQELSQDHNSYRYGGDVWAIEKDNIVLIMCSSKMRFQIRTNLEKHEGFRQTFYSIQLTYIQAVNKAPLRKMTTQRYIWSILSTKPVHLVM